MLNIVRQNLSEVMREKGAKPTTISQRASPRNKSLIKNLMDDGNDVGVETVVKLANALGVSFYRLVGSVPPEASLTAERITAIEDILVGARSLLTLMGAQPEVAEAFLRALPTIAQAARSSRLEGCDVPSAVSAIARHMWSESFPEVQLQ